MKQLLFGAFLLLLVVILPGCGGDSSTNSGNDGDDDGGQANVMTVSVRDNTFQPKSLRVQPGTTVRWVLESDMTDHTTTANNGKWDSGFVFRNRGDSFQYTFTAADNNQTFLYHCVTHWVSDEMQGSVLVGNDPPAPPPRY